MNVPKGMVHMIHHMMGQQNKPPLDRLAVPKEHILEVLTLAQRMQDLQGKIGFTAASMNLWSFIRQIMPYVAMKKCQMDVSRSMAPMIEVTGEYRVPEAGQRGVIKAMSVPPQYHFRLYELMDLEDRGPLHSYNLWEYISTFLPDVAEDTEGAWSTDQSGDNLWVVLKQKKDEDDDG